MATANTGRAATCPTLVVVGASAGGLEAVSVLLRSLPADFPASVFVVIHRSAEGPTILPMLLARDTRLPIRIPVEIEPIRPGTVYLAPLDRHLLIEDSRVRPTRGPRQHGFRPAVDPLFISAAAAEQDCVAGVILSGALEDGTAGLLAIKNQGGTAIVQNPDEALVSSMPLSALRNVDVDAVLPVAEIGPYLVELTKRPRAPNAREPRRMGTMTKASTPEPAGKRKLTAFTCPDCGGALWEIEEGRLEQYECHVGHRFSTEALQALGDGRTENILWSAVRALKEAAALRRRMAAHATSRGMENMATRWLEDADKSQARADEIRDLIEAMNGGADREAGQPDNTERPAARVKAGRKKSRATAARPRHGKMKRETPKLKAG